MATTDLETRTRYDPGEVESRVLARWLDSGLFHPEAAGTAEENYSIAIPLPNVTGALHMGHALNGSVQDTLIRLARMRGKRTKWIFGTDHAGIGTQTLVERALIAEGTSREELGRERFVERVWRWRDQYGSTIVEQFKRLGASCDYEDERFTLDPPYVEAVLKVFVDLYDKGWIYRDNYMVNWDPGSRSAISDLEVEQREVTDTLYYVDYPLESGHGSVTIATVRPETMLADTAIAVHPDDDRYTRLVGEAAILPLVGRRLRIIADPYVKPEFGTGALKITPGHDPNDFEIGRAHGLEEVTVIGEDGRMTAAAGRFEGMTALEAREAVVEALRAEGRIARTQQYRHDVPFSQRTGERIEPLISLQWFMRMDELARPAIEVVESGRVRIHPEGQRRRYLEWMANLRPWCISRQLWWGHQIPVWYRGDETYAGVEPPTGAGWERDPDVLDTWFSSGLWPFVTLGWPDDTAALRAFYPTDVLSTARDILFLWVARMVMLGIEFAGDIPFDDVYVHSVIQAPDGRRMSKSLGTGIDPMDLIDGGPRPPVFEEGGDFPAYGADAVRFGLLASSSTQDVRFNEERVAQGRQLANKLWNASRLVLLRVPGGVSVQDAAPHAEAIEDRWILSRLQAAERDVAQSIDGFEFHAAALRLYDFIYGELCDWYLEMLKPRLYADDNRAACGLALHVLGETLALAHPMIPFVTEEIWAHVPGADGLLMVRRHPEPDEALVDEAAEADVARAIAATQELRGWRDRVGAAAGKLVPARLEADGYETTAEHVARLARVEWSSNGGEPVATVGVPGGSIAVLASEAVDLEAAARRAEARRAALEKEIARSESKLTNEGFVTKAPAAVVERERKNLERLKRELADCDGVAPRGRRGPPPLAGAVRHALRARAHAAADDRARQPAGALLRDPRGRDQRQVVDGPDVRRAARGARSAHGRVPVAASDLVRRADPDRRRRSRRGCVRGRGSARGGGRRQGRPHARAGRPGDAVRAADRRRVLGARARRRRGRGRRGGPRRAARRHQRARGAGRGAHQRRPRAHALARADGHGYRAREARSGPAGRDARDRTARSRGGAACARSWRASRAGDRGGSGPGGLPARKFRRRRRRRPSAPRNARRRSRGDGGEPHRSSRTYAGRVRDPADDL